MEKKKNGILYLCLLLIVGLTSCTGLEEEIPEANFEISDLYGTWQSGTLYYTYTSNGNGKTWDTADDVTEDEAQPFTWTVDESQMVQIHLGEMGEKIPKTYIITKLTSEVLNYYDYYASSKTYSFKKVK